MRAFRTAPGATLVSVLFDMAKEDFEWLGSAMIEAGS